MSCPRIPTNSQSQVQRVIAITSGKGGVGKSVVTALMGVSLCKLGYRVGILDCDLGAPSITSIFGLGPGHVGQDIHDPDISDSGIRILSMGMLRDQERPLLWRSIPACSILKEFWQTTNWGELDYLFLDLPNSSDVQLMALQEFPLDGVVLVTTPQRQCLQATKHISKVAQTFQVKVLGTVINRTSFNCPVCDANLGLRDQLLAKRLKAISELPVLEVLPYDLSFLTLCEDGKIELATTMAFQNIPSQFRERMIFC